MVVYGKRVRRRICNWSPRTSSRMGHACAVSIRYAWPKNLAGCFSLTCDGTSLASVPRILLMLVGMSVQGQCKLTPISSLMLGHASAVKILQPLHRTSPRTSGQARDHIRRPFSGPYSRMLDQRGRGHKYIVTADNSTLRIAYRFISVL